jgi:two-component system sensor histidine kinase PhoQ
MRFNPSIRSRLLAGAAVVLLVFMVVAGLAVRQAHEDSVRAAHFAQLQGTVYLLLAGAELDASGALIMPAGFAEPRLSLPGSGLYASIVNVNRGEQWRSPSTVGIEPPFERNVGVGEWRYDTRAGNGTNFLAVGYGVKWAGRAVAAPLVLSVLEDKAAFDREIRAFERTLWGWLGGAGLVLLAAQTVLLGWALAPLRRVALEIRRIENGEQAEVQGRYPAEIGALTSNLNALIGQERVRQTRYREALSFLAHSLKTPLAVLRGTLSQPEQLPVTVAEQVTRMDAIVQHQLSRAAATGAGRFVPPLAIAPVVERIRSSLAKVYADKGIAFTVDCPADLSWRLDEGDAFEMLGNVLDNAAKWARQRVAVRAWRDGGRLRIRVDDDGAGFSDTQSILKLHVRMDERVPGHGVGLAVVTDLVASHHGELNLSRGELGGARVEIVLPVA